jgi:hypothetical protein
MATADQKASEETILSRSRHNGQRGCGLKVIENRWPADLLKTLTKNNAFQPTAESREL